MPSPPCHHHHLRSPLPSSCHHCLHLITAPPPPSSHRLHLLEPPVPVSLIESLTTPISSLYHLLPTTPPNPPTTHLCHASTFPDWSADTLSPDPRRRSQRPFLRSTSSSPAAANPNNALVTLLHDTIVIASHHCPTLVRFALPLLFLSICQHLSSPLIVASPPTIAL